MEKETLTLRGNRALWIQFVTRVKEERKTVWDVLEQLLKNYLNRGHK